MSIKKQKGIAEAKAIFLENLKNGWSIEVSKARCTIRGSQFERIFRHDEEIQNALIKYKQDRIMRSKSIADYRMLNAAKN
jgi:hypothetical protein